MTLAAVLAESLPLRGRDLRCALWGALCEFALEREHEALLQGDLYAAAHYADYAEAASANAFAEAFR